MRAQLKHKSQFSFRKLPNSLRDLVDHDYLEMLEKTDKEAFEWLKAFDNAYYQGMGPMAN